jgi:UDP-GlcNAc:undecaprenyl-phosphate GlcNAc-1-phosphate transferase
VPVIAGFALSFVLTPVARRAATHFGILAHPVGGRIHLVPTPLMGGVAVYCAFAASTLLFLPLGGPVRGVLFGGLAAVTVGVLDERVGLPPLLHLAGQVGAAAIAVVCGVGVLKTLSIPTASLTAPGWHLPVALGAVITLVWIVGMMNTVNFLDGLDGLATGVGALAAVLLAAWAAEKSHLYIPSMTHHEDLILPLALAGTLVGFLPYNWHRAKIFLGDSGAMFLGLALATLSIVGPAKLATALLVLLIPVLDVAWAIVRRQFRGRSFLSGDKEHVYHRMMQLGLSHTTTVLLLYLLVVAFAVLDLVLYKTGKVIAFILLAIATGSTFVLLEIRASRGDKVGRPETLPTSSRST